MCTKDKKILNKAFYVYLTVSSIMLSTDGYSMTNKDDKPEDYIMTNSGKRIATKEPEDRANKKQKSDQGQTILIGPRASSARKRAALGRTEGSVQPVNPSLRERLDALPPENYEKGLKHLTEKGILSTLEPSSHVIGHGY